MIRRLNLPDSAEPDREGLLHAPSAARNQKPILDALGPHLPHGGLFLEVASGTGQHVAALAAEHPDLRFQPSEPDPVRRRAIDARTRDLPNVAPARYLDACTPGWGRGLRADVILTVNLLHLISDAEMAVLLDEAAQAIVPGGLLAIYGPFLRGGQATSEGDAGFHMSLQRQDPSIGLKDADLVVSVLQALAFAVDIVPMPANNLMLLARSGSKPGF
ncbi:hypothetical protein jaqu_40060 [Jannaschia aquimarina]|uniref:Methyltransferase domain protein n=2 Tax=Jannaschia aquimarina TaxID=935700 RepID=A0A0D1D256_9RHOB|nr:hypothetical protein jaqu_40060 [Jannaschia aquimarina]SNS48304.1 Protein of unknown function [Jannaschia aquimarina]